MDTVIEVLISELESSVIWIDGAFRNLDVDLKGERAIIAAGCLDVAIEHQSAMLLLCKGEMFGLLFAAQRLIFEALLRGLWFAHCATEKQLEDYIAGTGPPKYKVMIEAIERAVGDQILPLETYRARLEKHLHEFTHTGYLHLIRRRSAGAIGPNYSSHDLGQVINLAVLLGYQAAARLANIFNEGELEGEANRRLVAYGSRRQAAS